MKMYVVDAFTKELFKGNPAAVCIVNEWPNTELMRKIAMENRFSETAFTIKIDNTHYKLRWFTPGGEIDLCGHATLATAFVVFNKIGVKGDAHKIVFFTKSGDLIVTKNDDRYEMSFPSYNLKKIPVTNEMTDAFGKTPIEAYLGRDLLCIFDDENFVKNMNPNQEKLAHLPGLLQHATAKGTKFDCVSRSFAPKLSVPEDPVCGSGHCHIIPYWAKQLNKNDLVAFQASPRSGILYCTYLGKDTILAGNAVLYSEGKLNI
ncbi:PhzF family phenazine biosynthesis protein [Lactobacillus sp. LL6]|uniref:PhzF family phenazine biosynthesis protein n=1 Tax=Lactobacillus sp. LL6 TaxID=2596827 RepID=UPI0011858A2E|nr:PhzF family phenazine biosynthesis protein [Lactobacillus sp. LL6]TSO25416.1 PhzF family phenazine biosynthesis protein [Lactobacillus sp. LL6]